MCWPARRLRGRPGRRRRGRPWPHGRPPPDGSRRPRTVPPGRGSGTTTRTRRAAARRWARATRRHASPPGAEGRAEPGGRAQVGARHEPTSAPSARGLQGASRPRVCLRTSRCQAADRVVDADRHHDHVGSDARPAGPARRARRPSVAVGGQRRWRPAAPSPWPGHGDELRERRGRVGEAVPSCGRVPQHQQAQRGAQALAHRRRALEVVGVACAVRRMRWIRTTVVPASTVTPVPSSAAASRPGRPSRPVARDEPSAGRDERNMSMSTQASPGSGTSRPDRALHPRRPATTTPHRLPATTRRPRSPVSCTVPGACAASATPTASAPAGSTVT